MWYRRARLWIVLARASRFLRPRSDRCAYRLGCWPAGLLAGLAKNGLGMPFCKLKL